MYKRSVQGWAKHWDFITADIIVLVFSFFLAYFVRHGVVNPLTNEAYRTLFFVVLLADLVVSIAFNTFSGVLKTGYLKLFWSSCKHVLAVLMVNTLFTFMMQTGENYSRIMVFLTAFFHLFLGYCTRMILRNTHTSYQQERSIFLVTTSESVADAVNSIRQDISKSIRLVGIAVIDKNMVGSAVVDGGIRENCTEGDTITADRNTVLDALTREWVDGVFFRVPRNIPDYEKFFSAFMEMGLTIHVDIGNISTYSEQKQAIEKIGRSVVLTTAINTISGMSAFLKRAMDILGGIVGSIIALLIMLIFAIPVKAASPGPLLYTSERIGLNGKRFRMYKIRTMYLDADKRKAELMEQNRVKDGMMFKLDWDPRIIGNRMLPDGTKKTGIGEFLRKTSLDEFPQFFNVFMAQMSLVGTRPPTPDEWEKYELHHRARMSTKPGITGMWQVSGRSDITDFEQVVKLDTNYITNWSLGLDIRILLRTILVIFTHKGAM